MLYAIVAVVVLILDQAMKYWTTLHLELNSGLKELIPGLIHLRNYHNTGSAFSMFGDWAGARWMFLIVTLLFTVLVILALAKKLITGKFGRWMALLVLAGALGNGIDRVLYGYVVDMFQFGFWQSFPIFNVADIFITVCGVLFCVYIILHKDPLSVPTETTYRKGPGGSVTSKPAPKRVAKPEKVAPVVEPVAEPAAQPAAAEAPEQAEKPAGPRRLAAKDEAKKSVKLTMPKLPKLPTLPKREEKDAEVPAPRAASARRTTMRQTESSPFDRIQRPVVTRESFIEMTKHKPGDDPFAEWMQPKTEPAAPAAPAVEPVAAPEVPVREVEPEMPVHEIVPESAPVEAAVVAEPEIIPEPVAEPAPAAAPAEPVVAEVKEDTEFSLEDILNEFRNI